MKKQQHNLPVYLQNIILQYTQQHQLLP